MINPEKAFNLHDYIEIFLRRLWYMIIPFVIILTGTIMYALHTPKEYRSSTLILVTPQKVPESFVKPTVTSKIEDRLQSISQEIMSRTRLEKVISEFRLYSEEARSLPAERIIELMRKNIEVEIKGKEGYFTISYIGKDPRTITLVTNKLASLFIEENLKLREQQAQGTSEFLLIELTATKTKLEEQEKDLTQFKKQFMGELPEQREANLRVLEQLQIQYSRIGESIRSAHDRKLILQRQTSDFEFQFASLMNQKEDPSVSMSPINPAAPGVSFPLTPTRPVVKTPDEIQLEQFKNHLRDLQAKYTDRHPDLLIARKRMTDLEAKIEKERLEREAEEKREMHVNESYLPPVAVSGSSSPGTARKDENRKKAPDIKANPRFQELERQLIALDLEIERLKEEESKAKTLVDKYRNRIEVTPMRELAMANLMRDHQNTREAYQTLLKKSEEAQQAENLERRQKGEQFRVIDSARIPEKPFKPNVPKILLFGLLLGLGSGFGLAFFREQMDRSFRDAEDLEAALGFKVLANIPKIEKKAA